MLLYCNENIGTILALSLHNTSINNKLNKNKCRETKTLAHKLNTLFNKSKKANALLLKDIGFFLLRIKKDLSKWRYWFSAVKVCSNSERPISPTC